MEKTISREGSAAWALVLVWLCTLIVGNMSYTTTDVLCNNGTAHECVCHEGDHSLRASYSSCKTFVRPNVDLPVIAIRFAGLTINAKQPTGEPYETAFKKTVARIIGGYCIRHAQECPGTSLPIKLERVVVLSVKCTINVGNAAPHPTNQTIAQFVIMHNTNALQLERRYVMNPGLVIRILLRYQRQLSRDVGSMQIKNIYSETIYIKSVPMEEERPIVPPVEGKVEQNKILVYILSGIGCSLLVCYVIAIYKVCVDYHERKKAEREKEKEMLNNGQPTAYGAIGEATEPRTSQDTNKLAESSAVFSSERVQQQTVTMRRSSSTSASSTTSKHRKPSPPLQQNVTVTITQPSTEPSMEQEEEEPTEATPLTQGQEKQPPVDVATVYPPFEDPGYYIADTTIESTADENQIQQESVPTEQNYDYNYYYNQNNYEQQQWPEETTGVTPTVLQTDYANYYAKDYDHYNPSDQYEPEQIQPDANVPEASAEQPQPLQTALGKSVSLKSIERVQTGSNAKRQAPGMNADGGAFGRFGTVQDISEKRRHESDLSSESDTDVEDETVAQVPAPSIPPTRVVPYKMMTPTPSMEKHDAPKATVSRESRVPANGADCWTRESFATQPAIPAPLPPPPPRPPARPQAATVPQQNVNGDVMKLQSMRPTTEPEIELDPFGMAQPVWTPTPFPDDTIRSAIDPTGLTVSIAPQFGYSNEHLMNVGNADDTGEEVQQFKMYDTTTDEPPPAEDAETSSDAASSSDDTEGYMVMGRAEHRPRPPNPYADSNTARYQPTEMEQLHLTDASYQQLAESDVSMNIISESPTVVAGSSIASRQTTV